LEVPKKFDLGLVISQAARLAVSTRGSIPSDPIMATSDASEELLGKWRSKEKSKKNDTSRSLLLLYFIETMSFAALAA
jgi:hypothetical protein